MKNKIIETRKLYYQLKEIRSILKSSLANSDPEITVLFDLSKLDSILDKTNSINNPNYEQTGDSKQLDEYYANLSEYQEKIVLLIRNVDFLKSINEKNQQGLLLIENQNRLDGPINAFKLKNQRRLFLAEQQIIKIDSQLRYTKEIWFNTSIHQLSNILTKKESNFLKNLAESNEDLNTKLARIHTKTWLTKLPIIGNKIKAKIQTQQAFLELTHQLKIKALNNDNLSEQKDIVNQNITDRNNLIDSMSTIQSKYPFANFKLFSILEKFETVDFRFLKEWKEKELSFQNKFLLNEKSCKYLKENIDKNNKKIEIFSDLVTKIKPFLSKIIEKEEPPPEKNLEFLKLIKEDKVGDLFKNDLKISLSDDFKEHARKLIDYIANKNFSKNKFSFILSKNFSHLNELYEETNNKITLSDIELKLLQIAILVLNLLKENTISENSNNQRAAIFLYYYFTLTLKITHDKAKIISEAVANNDYGFNKSPYFFFIQKKSDQKVIFNEIKNSNLGRNIFQEIIYRTDHELALVNPYYHSNQANDLNLSCTSFGEVMESCWILNETTLPA